MQIKTLQENYVQKSKLFLYPFLEIRKGSVIKPKETYLAWDGKYKTSDNRLIVVYKLLETAAFIKFEEEKLFGNERFCDFYELEDGTGAYVFDFSKNKLDFQNIVKGKYSLLSEDHKNKVLSFFQSVKAQQIRIRSYLKPKHYIDNYAELLLVDRAIIEKVGELCNAPDLKKEKLMVKQKIITFTNK